MTYNEPPKWKSSNKGHLTLDMAALQGLDYATKQLQIKYMQALFKL